MFGGGLPVLHRTVTASAKGMGDRSHKPSGQMDYRIHRTFMNVRKQATRKHPR
ncbi:hypothetical protein MJ257_23470 [Paenibacillus timonensis]|jgi:hypothetical protein|uniref:Uncharacterized protein n=2 Tax=Paenibacillus timonensis TaxID=225915 RepID=A0ABW3SIC5_9BACL|nr:MULTISPECIES: hypothetical protein [Paenibacillus]MCH1643062.1 hypothetical protein [Paenibacillus timonensis]MDU2239712.1 hypothetical protein [Paenibacillus sp.]GJM79307.1 hypothetical protein HMSSN139_18030 [Paenibacillus sp. HMSSN-139]